MLRGVLISVLLDRSITDNRQITEFDKNNNEALRNLTKGSCFNNKGDRTSVIQGFLLHFNVGFLSSGIELWRFQQVYTD